MQIYCSSKENKRTILYIHYQYQPLCLFFPKKLKQKKYDIFKTFIDFDQTRTINTSSFIEYRCNNSNSVQFHIAAILTNQ